MHCTGSTRTARFVNARSARRLHPPLACRLARSPASTFAPSTPITLQSPALLGCGPGQVHAVAASSSRTSSIRSSSVSPWLWGWAAPLAAGCCLTPGCCPQVIAYDALSCSVRRTFSRFKDKAYSGCFRGDGRLLVAGGEEGIVQVRERCGYCIVQAIEERQLRAPEACMGPDSKTVPGHGRAWCLPYSSQLQQQ